MFMRTHTYKVLLKKEPEGGFTVFVPALEGCITYGETLEEAQKNAKEAELLVPISGSTGSNNLKIVARSPGAWGNNLRIEIDHETRDPKQDEIFNLTVYGQNMHF